MYAFENVRFLVSSGVLRADVALSFTTGADDKRQVWKNTRSRVNVGVFCVRRLYFAYVVCCARGVRVEVVPIWVRRSVGGEVTPWQRWYPMIEDAHLGNFS